MHEFSLMNDLMRQVRHVASKYEASRVVGLKVRLGALSHISADHFREHFLDAARGGPAERATLEIEIDTDQASPSAQDILLESIEVEQ